MPLCPSCGAINAAQTSVCKRCGEQLSSGAGATEADWSSHEQIIGGPQGDLPFQRTVVTEVPASTTPLNGCSFPGETGAGIPQGPSALQQFSGERPAWLGSGGPLQQDPTRGIPQYGPGSTTYGAENPAAGLEDAPRYLGARPALLGRIFQAVERPAEPPDFDLWLWASRILVVSLIMGLLFLSWEEVYRRIGLLLVGGIIGFFWLVSRIRGIGVLFIVGVLGLGRLFGTLFRAPQELLPVRLCRLLDDQGQEHIIRIKGRIIRGDVDQEDRLAVWGHLRQGTWHFRRGFNMRPRSWVLIEDSYTWVTTIILVLLNLWLGWRLYNVHPEWFF